LVTTSWDDGHPMDLKLASLLSEFGIKGTFYVAPHNKERDVLSGRALRKLSARFEIGAHTHRHVKLTGFIGNVLEEEIRGSKITLENILGMSVCMFCYPWGKYNRRVRQAVVSAGYIGARTTKEFYLNLGTDSYQMPTTIQAFPLPTLIRLRHEIITRNWHGLRKLLQIGLSNTWIQVAREMFDEVLQYGGVWHLWGHSWEIEEYGLWDDLSMLLGHVANRKDVQYLSNAQVIRELS